MGGSIFKHSGTIFPPDCPPGEEGLSWFTPDLANATIYSDPVGGDSLNSITQDADGWLDLDVAHGSGHTPGDYIGTEGGINIVWNTWPDDTNLRGKQIVYYALLEREAVTMAEDLYLGVGFNDRDAAMPQLHGGYISGLIGGATGTSANVAAHRGTTGGDGGWHENTDLSIVETDAHLLASISGIDHARRTWVLRRDGSPWPASGDADEGSLVDFRRPSTAAHRPMIFVGSKFDLASATYRLRLHLLRVALPAWPTEA